MQRRLAAVARWSARILGLLIMALTLVMAAGETLSPHAHATPPTTRETLGLVCIAGLFTSYLSGWKWEARGAALGIFSVLGFCAAAPNAPFPMYGLMLAPPVLFLVSRRLSREAAGL